MCVKSVTTLWEKRSCFCCTMLCEHASCSGWCHSTFGSRPETASALAAASHQKCFLEFHSKPVLTLMGSSKILSPGDLTLVVAGPSFTLTVLLELFQNSNHLLSAACPTEGKRRAHYCMYCKTA